MRKPFACLVTALVLVVNACLAAAQNTTFTYQGRVQDNGTNYTGSGQFKFALLVSTNTSSQATAAIYYSGTLGNLSVNSCQISYGGSGYVTAPAVSFTGGSPNASGYATISGGSVTAITVTSGGNYTGYTPPQATITIAPPPNNFTNLAIWSNDGTTGIGISPASSVTVGVTNGLFTQVLGNSGMAALPATVFDQASLQLQIWFNDGVNGFNAFPPQTLTPAPYAVVAGSLSSPLTLAQLPAGALTNGASGVNLSGTFGGNGSGVTDVNASALNGLAANNFWQAGGNNVTTGQVLGSTNNQPLEIVVGNQQVGLFTPGINGPDIILGPAQNTISGGNAGVAILGGASNTVTIGDNFSVIAGGHGNVIQTNNADGAISGGYMAGFSTYYACSVISGGYDNAIGTNSLVSVISGGAQNIIGTESFDSVISGGEQNLIEAAADASVVSGGFDNLIGTTAAGSVISGGSENVIGTNSGYAVVSGGYGNSIEANAAESVIAGGNQNIIETNGYDSVIAGGVYNVIGNNSPFSAIGSGFNNVIGYSCSQSTIVGGALNNIEMACNECTIAGGSANTIQEYTSSATIGGGNNNFASWGGATVSGGESNTATQVCATVPGGFENLAGGSYSFAAGQQAQALQQGAFVWADSQNAVFASAVNDSFNIRAQGGIFLDNSTPAINFGGTTKQMLNLYGLGYGIGVQNNTEYFRSSGGYAWFNGGSHNNSQNNPGSGGTAPMTLDGSGNLECAGTVYSKGIALTSDRNAKENFTPVDNAAVLAQVAALSVTKWNYKTDHAGVQHIGPMAQDFQAAFGLDGADDKHISVVDEGGVALAAIQGLNQKVEAAESEFRGQRSEVRIEKLEKENAELKQRLEELKQLVQSRAVKN